MAMHHPHPGEFISGVYLEPNGISGHELAEKLDVARVSEILCERHTMMLPRSMYATQEEDAGGHAGH